MKKKTFLVKIVPPGGTSVYRLAFSGRHLVLLAGLALLGLLGAAGLHSYQLRVAEANVRALQALTARQQAQLHQIDAQADGLAGQLRAVQRENAEIRRLIGADRGRGKAHAFAPPPGTLRGAGFARLHARLAVLSADSAATRADARRLQRLVLRVLDLRRMAAIAHARMLAAIPSLNPVGGSVAAGFGWRTDPWPEFHKGLDLAADYGTEVHAAAAGTVVSAGWDGGFGNKVDIDHGNGYHTWYAHLSRFAVAPGQRVTKGQPIAYVGATGEATGPHLHYQVMYQGTPVDPQPFLNGVPPKVLATLPGGGGV